MSGNFGPKASTSRSPNNGYDNRNLSKMCKSDLIKIKVAIKRSISGTESNLPLERNIDDPVKICPHVHFRKGKPPRVPIFGGDIKVNQDFSEDRTVFTHEKNNRRSRRSRSRSRSRSRRYKSRSKDRSRNEEKRTKSRDRSRSRDRNRKSWERNKRSSSRRRSKSRRRSRSGNRRYRDYSSEGHRRSRSRSISPSEHEPHCAIYKASRERRSITPLRPGEYRPGHPDLAFRKVKRKSRSRSTSPRRSEKGFASTSRERRSPGRSRSPHRERRRSRSRHRSPAMPMAGMEYSFYDPYAPPGMHPFRGRFPMVEPGFYPRMFPPNLMMPRMPMHPMMRMPMHRWPNYNSLGGKPVTSKPATATSSEVVAKSPIVEHPNEDAEKPDSVSSSDKVERSSKTGLNET